MEWETINLTPDFFFILGELLCGRDIDLTSINIDTQKGSTSVANKESPRNLEFMPLVVSLGNHPI